MSDSPPKTEFDNLLVQKPWGYEYLMYENGTVAIWFLFIRHGERTSLHCHPKKKTGLILLSGEVILSFLNDSMSLKALSKAMIRQGMFHSTASVSEDGSVVIEIETPVDKEDLVRLEDEYGRKGEPYEGADWMLPRSADCARLETPEKGGRLDYEIGGCHLSVESFDDVSALRGRDSNELIAILNGGLQTKAGEQIVNPGDVVNKQTLDRLTETFQASPDSLLLAIRK